ncbi:MAG: SUMF1/EgtB/PvdO family nonheme iron enzyme [Flavobacteriales bacterium]|nr:SUMF1/EgtB/PvdO family nonheme iron enzyme [Flavobacteriales bacterium]
MKLFNTKHITYSTVGILLLVLASCSGGQRSGATGWEYNNKNFGAFMVLPYFEQETGPGLVLIEGGSFVMGQTEQSTNYDWNITPRKVTVSSYYMDQTEVRNVDYREYLHWKRRIYLLDYPEIVKKALPDTLVWRDRLAYNEPYVEYYFRHPAYSFYPVVGVNWIQANDFCKWRTDRVNEFILVREQILDLTPWDQTVDDFFDTDAYLLGLYEGVVNKPLPDLDPNSDGERKVRLEDGILLPKYRLPTEAEWEFAAYGLIGNTIGERIPNRRLYPWNGRAGSVRNPDEAFLGNYLANTMRGRGDMMGVAGQLNDNADITSPVISYWPNDYGLYNMAGNVSEWVLDVYRAMSHEDVSDFRPYRGNTFTTLLKDEDGIVMEKDSLGLVQYREVSLDYPEDELSTRRNYRRSDNINYMDGDTRSSTTDDWLAPPPPDEEESLGMYKYAATSLVNDEVMVFKGASWRDRIYWMNPGTRRFLEQDEATAYLGFRCAMDRVGSPNAFNAGY